MNDQGIDRKRSAVRYHEGRLAHADLPMYETDPAVKVVVVSVKLLEHPLATFELCAELLD